MATKPRVSIQRANPLFPGLPGRGNPGLDGLGDEDSRKQVVEINGRMVLVDLITGNKIDLGPITAAPEKSQTSGATPTTWGGMFIDDGQGSGYYADANGRRLNPQEYQEAVAAGRTPAAAAAPLYPEGGVTTTGQTYKIDRYTGDITLGPIYGTLATTRTPQQLRQDVLEDIAAQRAYTDKQTADSQRYNTGERLGGQTFNSGEGQLGRQFTSGENTLNRQFQGAESMLGRQFTSGESAIDRAQRAGEFAANYSITKAQAQRQDREAALNAAKTYTELTASPDLTGFQRFLSAGGGSVGNALQRGATSMTREGQLGGARALQVSEQPLPTYMDYNYAPQTNPYAGATNQYMGMTNPYANAMNPVIAIQRAAVPAATIPAATVTPRAVVAPSIDGGSWNPGTSGQSYLDRPNVPDFVKPGYVAPPMPSPASTPAPFVTQAAVPSEGLQWDAGSGFAYGTKVGPIYRYALGTQDMPVGMDTQFMSGDSTSLDPMSGGARPETVSINDPTGDATFSVDPLQPPDGPSEGGRAAELSALLKALSQFLDKGEEPAPMPVAPRYAFGTYMMPEAPRYGLGTSFKKAVRGVRDVAEGAGDYARSAVRGLLDYNIYGDNLEDVETARRLGITPAEAAILRERAIPRYAYGTGIMESDNPYIDRVMAQRQATPYTMNTQAADYSFGSPTLRSINEMGAQVATGVPMVEFGYEANRLRPGMLSSPQARAGTRTRGLHHAPKSRGCAPRIGTAGRRATE